MMVLANLGKGGYADGALYLLDLDEPNDLPQQLELPSRKFVCLIAWDSVKCDVTCIANLAKRTMELGAAAVSVWGNDCERVHDVFDEMASDRVEYDMNKPVLMTTWHSNETLDEAVWFVLHSSIVDDLLEKDCKTTLAISIGNPTWAHTIRKVFSNPKTFDEAQLRPQP
jgi:hypothetical protein